jgi:hypothetical protein
MAKGKAAKAPKMSKKNLAQAVPAGPPNIFGAAGNRPVNQTIGGVQQLPIPQGPPQGGQ